MQKNWVLFLLIVFTTDHHTFCSLFKIRRHVFVDINHNIVVGFCSELLLRLSIYDMVKSLWMTHIGITIHEFMAIHVWPWLPYKVCWSDVERYIFYRGPRPITFVQLLFWNLKFFIALTLGSSKLTLNENKNSTKYFLSVLSLKVKCLLDWIRKKTLSKIFKIFVVFKFKQPLHIAQNIICVLCFLVWCGKVNIKTV